MTSNGGPVVRFRFHSKEGLTQDEVKAELWAYEKKIKKGPFNKRVVTFSKHSAQEVSEQLPQGWRSSRWVPMSSPVALYNYQDNYNIPEGFKHPLVHNVDLYIAQNGVSGGADDKHNDCLWVCLRNAFGEDFLPKVISKASKLKKLVGVGRDDKIPYTSIPLIEAKCFTKIDVTGAHTYQSNAKHQREIKLLLENQHYSLFSERGTELIKNYHSKKTRICTFKEYDKGRLIKVFDGVSSEEYPVAEYKKLTQSSIHFINAGANTLEKAYADYMKDCEKLKEMDPILNLRQAGKMTTLVLWLFHQKTQSVRKPAPISKEESLRIDNAKKCGHIGCRKGHYEFATSYDINYCYGDIMRSTQRLFPIGAPRFEHLMVLPERPQYGMYHCEIEGGADFMYKPLSASTSTQVNMNLANKHVLNVNLAFPRPTDNELTGDDNSYVNASDGWTFQARINGNQLFTVPVPASKLLYTYAKEASKDSSFYVYAPGCYVDESDGAGAGEFMDTNNYGWGDLNSSSSVQFKGMSSWVSFSMQPFANEPLSWDNSTQCDSKPISLQLGHNAGVNATTPNVLVFVEVMKVLVINPDGGIEVVESPQNI